MTRDDGQRAARWLLAVVTFLIIYGSLYPFGFAAGEAHGCDGPDRPPALGQDDAQ